MFPTNSSALQAPASLDSLWRIVEQLTLAGRWHDAEVTLRAAGRETGILSIRVTLGTLLAERGDWRAAIEEWTAVIDEAQAVADTNALSAVYHNLAALYRESGDFRLAASFQQKSLSLLEEGRAEDFLQLAGDAIVRRQWDLAEKLLDVATGLDVDGDEQLDIESTAVQESEIEAMRGLLAGFRRDPHQARRALRTAYRNHSASGKEQLAAKDLVNLAAVLAQNGQPGLAVYCLNAAEVHANRVSDPLLVNRIERLRERYAHSRARSHFDPRWN